MCPGSSELDQRRRIRGSLSGQVGRDRYRSVMTDDDTLPARGGGFSPRFFLTPDMSSAVPRPVPGERLVLGPEDSHHGLRVLRMKVGDMCEVVTPWRTVHQAVVGGTADSLELTIVRRLLGDAAGPVYQNEVGLVQGIARPAAMDYLIEKGTEVGADFFALVPTEASPRGLRSGGTDRVKRWRRIAREAAKQSKQTRIPWVEIFESQAEAMTRLWGEMTHTVVLDPGAAQTLSDLLQVFAGGEGGDPVNAGRCSAGCRRVTLWVGPEGGWSAGELDRLVSAGALPAKLGRGVLRTETAGPVALAIARLTLNDW